jgi:hypothetical protein
MQSFQTAKNLLTILMYVGWAFVALCVIAGFVAMNETNVLLALIGAGLLSVVGFLIIGIAQMGLAQIATAENTGQMLEIMRKQSSVTRQEMPVNEPDTTPIPSTNVSPKDYGAANKTYLGYLITKTESGVNVEGYDFASAAAAVIWIKKNPK